MLSIMWVGLIQFTENLNRTGRRRRGRQRTGWMEGITDSVDMSLSSSGRWWRTGKPGVLQSMGSQRVWHNWATEQWQLNRTKNWPSPEEGRIYLSDGPKTRTSALQVWDLPANIVTWANSNQLKMIDTQKDRYLHRWSMDRLTTIHRWIHK